MTEARTGRLLAACLHQAIGEVLPLRLEFYEVWLRSQGMRDGSIGAAPMSAVLGFLRTEAPYHEVVARAGQLAAQWTIASMTPMRRRSVGWLPRQLRARAALRLVVRIAGDISTAGRTSARFRRGQARVEVADSIFCTMRGAQKAPMCGFYSSTAIAVFEMFDLPVRATIEQCLAVDGPSCILVIDVINA